MGDVIPMQSLDKQIDGIQGRLDELGDEYLRKINEIHAQYCVRHDPLRDKLWALKGRRGDEGFGEVADAG